MPELHAAWWRLVRLPLMLFVPVAAVLASGHADVQIARLVFFDAAHTRWIGAGNWLAGPFLHTGGRWGIRCIVAASAALYVASFFMGRLRELRRPAGYFTLASVLSIGIVGLLKTVTNVDCPWDLVPFGGHFPAVPLFGDRPDELGAAHCFPAAHASSGYALVALYFVFRERNRWLARTGLAIGMACGIVFGVAQQSRGAHFLSHDIWSAMLVWLTATSVYVFGFRMQLRPCSAGSTLTSSGVDHRLPHLCVTPLKYSNRSRTTCANTTPCPIMRRSPTSCASALATAVSASHAASNAISTHR